MTKQAPDSKSDTDREFLRSEVNLAGSDDPFDLAKLRLKQDFCETAGVKRLLNTVPIRRPGPQDFVRVHPDAAYRAPLAVIELRDDRETYLLSVMRIGRALRARIMIAGGAAWAVLGLANVFLKPLLTFIALPLIILTFGIAYFFVNVVVLLFTEWVTPDFSIDGFWTYVGATIVVWLVNWLLGSVLGLRRWEERWR